MVREPALRGLSGLARGRGDPARADRALALVDALLRGPCVHGRRRRVVHHDDAHNDERHGERSRLHLLFQASLPYNFGCVSMFCYLLVCLRFAKHF